MAKIKHYRWEYFCYIVNILHFYEGEKIIIL